MRIHPHPLLATLLATASLLLAAGASAAGNEVAPAGPCAIDAGATVSAPALKLISPQDVAAAPPIVSNPPVTRPFAARDSCDAGGACAAVVPDPPTNPPDPGPGPPL